jgi:hypothetical protein
VGWVGGKIFRSHRTTASCDIKLILREHPGITLVIDLPAFISRPRSRRISYIVPFLNYVPNLGRPLRPRGAARMWTAPVRNPSRHGAYASHHYSRYLTRNNAIRAVLGISSNKPLKPIAHAYIRKQFNQTITSY